MRALSGFSSFKLAVADFMNGILRPTTLVATKLRSFQEKVIMSKRKSLAVGDHVFAKWPGSSMYYKGVVVEYDDEQDAYDVKFDDDDSTLLLPAKDVYAEKSFTNPRGRSRSPSRKRSVSPGRKPTRSKSPSGTPRKPRSPGRKSVTAILEVQSDSFKKSSRTDDSILEEAAATLIKSGPSLQKATCEVSDVKVIAKTLNELSSKHFSESNSVLKSSSSTHSTEHTFVTRRMARGPSESVTKDTEKVEVGQQEPIIGCCSSILSGFRCSLKCAVELVISVAMLTAVVSVVFGLHFVCKSSTHCTFLERPRIPSWAKFFSWRSTGYVFGWYLFQAVLFIFPVGEIIQGPLLKDKSHQSHRLNGTIQLAVSFGLIGVLSYFGRLPTNHITGFYTSLITSTLLFGLLLSILVFIQERISLAARESGTVLSDFVRGRSVYPMLLKKFNVKAYGFRTGLITWGVLVLMHLAKHCATLHRGDWPNIALLIHVIMNVFYVTDHFVFEESLYFSASVTNEKVGAFMIVALFTFFPFFYSFSTRYLTMFPPTYPHIACYALPVVVFVVGFYIYRTATMEKLRFRKQLRASLGAGVDYILTQDGKNILVDGWWGRLRHPNYFADLLMAYSLAGICGFSHFLPWVYPLFLTVLLVFMARQDDALCKEKYGQSWVEYQQRVKYKLLPLIY